MHHLCTQVELINIEALAFLEAARFETLAGGEEHVVRLVFQTALRKQ